MPARIHVFLCSTDTYMQCVQERVFGSDAPWPLSIAPGDLCLLHHYECGAVLGLWRASSSGGRRLKPKLWGGKFPFQVKVELVSAEPFEVPRSVLETLSVDPASGRLEDTIDGDRANVLLEGLRAVPQLRDTGV